MTVSPGDILKVTWQATLGSGTIVQNVYHLRSVLVSGRSDANVVADMEQWLEDVYDELVTYMKSSITQDPCSVDVVEWDGTKWEIVHNVGLATPTIAYADTAAILPQQCAAFALFNTARPKSNGRKFIPAFTEAGVENGFLIAGALTAMAAYAAAVLAGYEIAPLDYYVTGIVREAADLFLDFTLAVVVDTVFTQRRRTPGVGA